MKVVILAGGLGSRLSEETTLRPKPMVEIGGKPILWHIMKTYACHGITEFIVALGYKAEVVKDYFLRFYAINNDLTIDLGFRGDDHSQKRSPNGLESAPYRYGSLHPDRRSVEAIAEVAR